MIITGCAWTHKVNAAYRLSADQVDYIELCTTRKTDRGQEHVSWGIAKLWSIFCCLLAMITVLSLWDMSCACFQIRILVQHIWHFQQHCFVVFLRCGQQRTLISTDTKVRWKSTTWTAAQHWNFSGHASLLAPVAQVISSTVAAEMWATVSETVKHSPAADFTTLPVQWGDTCTSLAGKTDTLPSETYGGLMSVSALMCFLGAREIMYLLCQMATVSWNFVSAVLWKKNRSRVSCLRLFSRFN